MNTQDQMTDVPLSTHKQVQAYAQAVQNNPKDDCAFASWGAYLVQTSMSCTQKDEQWKMVQQAIEKLGKAVELKQDSRSQQGDLALFTLGNAYYWEFFLEKNDAKAETSLKTARSKFEQAIKKEPENASYQQMLGAVSSSAAYDARKAAHQQRVRKSGGSPLQGIAAVAGVCLLFASIIYYFMHHVGPQHHRHRHTEL